MKNRNGFTLIEIIVTVSLIAVMMALTIPGIMKYTQDVDDDGLLAEAQSVAAVVKSSNAQLSLSGHAGALSLSTTDKEAIVKKANGSGYIYAVEFYSDTTYELKTFIYKVNGKVIQYSPSDDKFYFTINK